MPPKPMSNTDLRLMGAASLVRDGFANDREKARLESLLDNCSPDGAGDYFSKDSDEAASAPVLLVFFPRLSLQWVALPS